MNMYSAGSTNTHGANVTQSASEMTSERDANLGTPATVDCVYVECNDLGPDKMTISLAAGSVKFLSSSAQLSSEQKLCLGFAGFDFMNTCQITIIMAIVIESN